MDEEVTAVCIDNGSGSIKAGFAGDEAPRSIFRTLVGHSKVPQSSSEPCFGKDCLGKSPVLTISSPIERGIVHDWEDMEKIWHHTLHSELKV